MSTESVGAASRQAPAALFCALALVVLATLLARPAAALTFDEVDQRARTLASQRFVPPQAALPKALRELSYDQYRDIRFDPARALWRDRKLPFELQFFHPGGIFEHPVRINEVIGRQVRPVSFDPSWFNYGKTGLQPPPANVGLAGFRVHYALNRPDYKDEVLVFLGASYFRALGAGQTFGASARGLAVDTAERAGEEFPRFVEFWIERPAAGAQQLVIYGLLDSRRLTGAYRFVLRPGAETVTEVQARLHFREPVGKLGIAPLTSMYYFGENQRGSANDFRPEVHDSDGLSIEAANGEWIWRPLVNPRRLLVTSFKLNSPRGFGLMQRDRSFASYEDLEARYEMRPSLWIEPMTPFGAGRVELVQIPTGNEFNDNIVAYWVPEVASKPGVPLNLAYRIRWQMKGERLPPLAWVIQTRRGHGPQPVADEIVALTVDFQGGELRKLPDDAPLEADVAVNGGKREAVQVHRNAVTGGWRMVLHVRRTDKDQPIDVRAQLKSGARVMSETWSYIVPPV